MSKRMETKIDREKQRQDKHSLPGPDEPISRLRRIMEVLRNPDGGCPWDLKQSHHTLKPYLLEEACEVLDAVDDGDDDELCKELGDLLLQIVFHSQIAAEREAFTLDDVARRISEKLLRRHPHVFGDIKTNDIDVIKKNWDEIKSLEKTEKKYTDKDKTDFTSILDGVPKRILLRYFY